MQTEVTVKQRYNNNEQWCHKGDKWCFQVKQTVNFLLFKVDELLNESEIEQLIEQGVKVTIV